MSGIAGLLHLDGRPAELSALRALLGALVHRGGDGEGVWTDGPVGLGSHLRHVTPESLRERPIVHADGALTLVADVRLDNRDELVTALGGHSTSERPLTDPELILAAYARWGTGCTEHLLGDFAFAVWDGQARRLFLARDPFGVKPLFYAHRSDHLVAFGSEIKAVRLAEGVSDTLDELMVAAHLLAPVRDDPARTFYQDIRRLPPAHSLTAGPDGIRIEEYWRLDPERVEYLPSDAAYAEAFRAHFDEAVRCRMRSAFPVAAMLSGGMDSSSIAAVAAELQGGDVRTYSAVFPDVPACDESRYIDDVVAKSGVPSHRFSADQVSPLADLDAMLAQIDRPLQGGNYYLNWTLYRAAAADGARVILDGFDGDTTVSHGLGYFNELRTRGQWFTLAREVKAFAEVLEHPWRPAVWSWLRGPVLKATGMNHARRAARAAGRFVRTGTPDAISPTPLWRQLLSPDLVRRVEAELAPPLSKAKTEREQHHRLLMRPLMTEINELLDAAAVSAGIEVRLPFYDRRLVEFCLALPPEQKLRTGWSRYVLRQAMTGTLPESVRMRGGKTGLSESFDGGMRHYEHERIAHAGRSPGAAATYLNTGVLQDTAARYLAGEISSEEEVAFWRSFTLALWMRRDAHPVPATQAPPTEASSTVQYSPVRLLDPRSVDGLLSPTSTS